MSGGLTPCRQLRQSKVHRRDSKDGRCPESGGPLGGSDR